MSDFQQAIKWLKEGKKIKRKLWQGSHLFLDITDGDGNFKIRGDMHTTSENGLNYYSIEATDWEIYEEKESLSDKMFDTEGLLGRKIFVRDVKEKVQNAQKRLKKEINKIIKDIKDVKEKKVDCYVSLETYTNNVIISLPYEFDKVFKEEFGDKLI